MLLFNDNRVWCGPISGIIIRLPVRLGIKANKVFIDHVPVFFIPAEYNHFGIKVGRIIKCAQAQGYMVIRPAVAPKDRAAAIPAKSLGHLVSIVRLKNIIAWLTKYLNISDFEHCTCSMACTTNTLAILTMTMCNYYRFAGCLIAN
jgi:hypothetical protein